MIAHSNTNQHEKDQKADNLLLYNGQIITPTHIIDNGYVVISKGKIIEIDEGRGPLSENIISVDCNGMYIAPGAIDIHCHGGGGHDFMEGTQEAFRTIAATHARHGMTSVVATTACCSIKTMYSVLDTCEQLKSATYDGSNIIGVHLEGNCLNPKYKGGQPTQFFSLPNKEEYEAVSSFNGSLLRWSIAPELPGAIEMGRYLSQKGILPSIAHTEADYSTMKEAVRAGFRHVTHLYNAMSTIHKDREFKRAGVAESSYLFDDLTVEIIADGVHNPIELLLFVHKFKGTERTALVTDAMACAGIEGITTFDNGRIIIEDGVGKLADRSALASSIASSDQLIQVMYKRAGLPLHDIIRMASETPADIIGVGNRKGRLQKGYDADIMVFNDEIVVKKTIVGGRIVYEG